VFRVTGAPAVTLGHMAFGMDADKMIRAIAAPDTGRHDEVRGRSRLGIDQMDRRVPLCISIV